jgi:hypothetical protein
LKFHFGKLSWEQVEPPIEEGWNRIQSPSLRLGYGLAILIGLVVIFLLFMWLVAVSLFTSGSGIGTADGGGPVPWAAVIAALLLSIPAHELIHALWLPHMGLSPQSVMIIWPKKLWIGVYYDGCMTRGRWLMMRMAPFVCLTLFTVGLLTLFEFIPAPHALVVFLQLLFLINGIGSGGDLVAIIWVLFQVPTKTQICFHSGKAYWRSAG